MQLYEDNHRELIFSYVKKETDNRILIPVNVKEEAKLGLNLLRKGYKGGTTTGWNRAKQLVSCKYIDLNSLIVMRAWFAHHGPDAKNGGTSYPGYLKWIKNGRPMDKSHKNKYRGAVSWLIWGGDAAYRWLKTKKVRFALKKAYDNRRKASGQKKLKFNFGESHEESLDGDESLDDESLDDGFDIEAYKNNNYKQQLQEKGENKRKK